jgi:primosomal protein N'
MPAPTVCPECGGLHIRGFGLGTERVEEEVINVFPGATVIRMDSDTTTRKNAYNQMLGAFREGRADILYAGGILHAEKGQTIFLPATLRSYAVSGACRVLRMQATT